MVVAVVLVVVVVAVMAVLAVCRVCKGWFSRNFMYKILIKIFLESSPT